MALTTRDYHVEIIKLRSTLTQLEANLAKKRAQYINIENQLDVLRRDGDVTKQSIVETKEQIASLVETHGEPNIDVGF